MTSSLTLGARVRAVLAAAGIAAGTVVASAAAATPATAATGDPASVATTAATGLPAAPHHHPLLRHGSRGYAVGWVQRRLGVPHTSIFGVRTRAAVRAFQRHHRLAVDGVVGHHTWRALLAHPAAASASGEQRMGAHVASVALPSFEVRADRVLTVAKAQRGKPYVYGAAGPRAFDCSGLVQYVFRHALGKSLPHYTDSQYAASKHISRSELRPGDLVFVRRGGHESHVGIYAGHGYWWVAPHTGTHVQKQKIYAAKHVYGRVIH